MKNLIIRNSKASLFILILLITGGLSACEQAGKAPTTNIPATPGGLTAKAGNGSVNLSWTANTESNLKGYNVYLGEESTNLGQSKFVDKSKTSTTITGLKNKTKYYFAIDAENDGAKVSEKSAVVSATPIDTSFKPGDTEVYAPGRRGEQKTVTVNGKKLTYEVIDGLAILQGDIILGKASELEKSLTDPSTIDPLGMTCDGSTFAGIFTLCNKWDNNTIKYTFEDDWGSEANNRVMHTRIRNAIAHWQQKTNLRFVESTSGDRLLFRKSDGCSSFLGRKGSPFDDDQDVNLSMSCSLGNVIHEIGHAIGLLHEQSRSDSGSHIRVHLENIDLFDEPNFWGLSFIGKDVGPYDFGSIMHYNCTAFSANGLPTIEILDAGIDCRDVGQRVGLSEGDILSAYSLYLPNFSFSGTAAGSSIPRNTAFDLSLDFDREAVKDEYIIWTRSGHSGTIATGRRAHFVPLSWSTGTQTITASIVIKGVTLVTKSISYNITNVAPVVNIIEPSSPGLEFCKNSPVSFKATAYDADTRPNPNLPDSSISWKVNSGSTFATGATATRSFSVIGDYTITATATDSDGATDTDSIPIKIKNCTSTPPNVFITNPVDKAGSGPDLNVLATMQNAQGDWYYPITLVGGATDLEDGTLSGSRLVWKTNQAAVQPGGPGTGEQQLGVGNSINVKLYTSCSIGDYSGTVDHLITLTATDSDGLIRIITRLIRVQILC